MDTDPLLKPSTNKSGGNKLEQTAHHTNRGNYEKTNNIYNKPIATPYLSVDDPVVREETHFLEFVRNTFLIHLLK